MIERVVDPARCTRPPMILLGAAATAAPLAIPAGFCYFQFPPMLAILLLFQVSVSMSTDGTFRRWQGAWLLGVYGAEVLLQYPINIGSPHPARAMAMSDQHRPPPPKGSKP